MAKIHGGFVTDYSFFIAACEQCGPSITKLLASAIIDTSGSNANTRVVCGYNTGDKRPSGADWLTEQVSSHFKKLIVKGTTLQGTFVIDAWEKGSKAKCVKTRAADEATWIVGGATTD